MLGWIGRHRRDDRATSAVEFSIVAPIFLLLIFLIIQAGLWFYGSNVALTSAREGVSYLRLAGNNADPAAFRVEAGRISEVYAERLGMIRNPKAVATIDEQTGRVNVVVTGSLNLPGGVFDVREEATATLEQFRGDSLESSS